MLAWWTQILPVFLFKRVARRCGTMKLGACVYHDARPDILVRDEGAWRDYCVGRVEEEARTHGILSAEARFKHFGKNVVAEGVRRAFLCEAPKEGS